MRMGDFRAGTVTTAGDADLDLAVQVLLLFPPAVALDALFRRRRGGGLDPLPGKFAGAFAQSGVDGEDFLVADVGDDPCLAGLASLGGHPDIEIDDRTGTGVG